MISNIRDLVDVVPRLNIFGDDELARLCEQVKEKIASIEPDSLRPSKTFDPVARSRVKRDADELMEKFAASRAGRRARAGGRVMATRVHTESAQRTSDCVTELLRKQPFFGSLALRLPLRADPSRETLAIDGHEIRYSPKWVADTDAHVIETAMARVVMACALKHHTRRGERDPERWQLASQLVTHALLRDSGFTLPPDAEAWDGVSVEQAYDRLPEPQEDDSGGDGDSPSGGGDMGAATAGQPSAASNGDYDSSDDPSASPDDDDTQDENRPDGGGQNSDGDSDAPASHDPSGTGEIMDAGARGDGDAGDGESPVDVTAEEQAWDEAMHQAMNLARAEGKLPGGVEETVRNAHASTLDWRTLLRRHMTDAARRDYSWSFPNRRFIDGGLYLPSIRSEGIDAIAVIIDTSGSLPAQTLADFWAEVREVATEIQPESVHILQVDAAVQDAAEYAACDLPDEIVIKGRGGTDFRPGFAWLDEQGIQPSVCLYLTDMLCSSYSDAEPAFPVLWVNYSEPPGDWNREPWGERIDIAPDRRASP